MSCFFFFFLWKSLNSLLLPVWFLDVKIFSKDTSGNNEISPKNSDWSIKWGILALNVVPWLTSIKQAWSRYETVSTQMTSAVPHHTKVYVYNRERNTYTHSHTHMHADTHSRPSSTHIMWFPVWCVPLESPRQLLWVSRWILQSVWGVWLCRPVIGSRAVCDLLTSHLAGFLNWPARLSLSSLIYQL